MQRGVICKHNNVIIAVIPCELVILSDVTQHNGEIKPNRIPNTMS